MSKSDTAKAGTRDGRGDLGRLLRAFCRDRSGTMAIEFGVVGLLLVMMLLATMQFALLFLSQMSMHDVMSDAASGANTASLNDRAALNTLICNRLILVNNCASTLLLEKAPLTSYATTPQAITGTQFAAGAANDAMLLRAQATIISFVPGMPAMRVYGAALYVRP